MQLQENKSPHNTNILLAVLPKGQFASIFASSIMKKLKKDVNLHRHALKFFFFRSKNGCKKGCKFGHKKGHNRCKFGHKKRMQINAKGCNVVVKIRLLLSGKMHVELIVK